MDNIEFIGLLCILNAKCLEQSKIYMHDDCNDGVVFWSLLGIFLNDWMSG